MAMKRVAIVQSNYIPWKGYFDLIGAVDEFILYDDMQYTKRDWRNRNRIKTPGGVQWLSVPVAVKGRFHQKINETEIIDDGWQKKHWNSLCHSYSKSPYFSEVSQWLEPLYFGNQPGNLSDLNRIFISAICDYLGITTKISTSSDYSLIDGKTERLASLCKQADADTYVSGPSARNYIDPVVFRDLNIDLQWFQYPEYLAYPQPWGNFVHQVTILDLLVSCGHRSPDFMSYRNT